VWDLWESGEEERRRGEERRGEVGPTKRISITHEKPRRR